MTSDRLSVRSGSAGARAGEQSRFATRTAGVVATLARLMAAAITLIGLVGLTVGYSMSTESAWFSGEAERIGLIAGVGLAALVVGTAIALLAINVGKHKPGTWALGLAIALVCTQLSLIAGAVLADGLTLWLARTPHRQEAKFYSAQRISGSARTASCAQKITVQPALPQFAGRYASFCAPEVYVEPGLNKDDRVVLVGRANWLGFVAERVERAR